MNEMKICLMFCGELRTFDNDFVISNWKKFIEEFSIENEDIYISAWDNRGRSVYSKNNDLKDSINSEEKIEKNYVGGIYNTENVKLFNFANWLKEVENLEFFKFKTENSQQFNATFGLSFLRYEAVKMTYNKKEYDVTIITRPDCVFIDTPPSYFLDGSDVIWHQRYNFGDVIYSTFFSSISENIIKLCSWYDDSDFINRTMKKIKRFEHCHVLYEVCQDLNIKDDTYRGTLFCEPFRSNDDFENIKKFKKKFWILG